VTYDTKIKYGIHEDVANKIILVDGIARSGKTLFNSIIPSLENVEHTRPFILLEQMIPAVAQGSINPQFAKAFFRVHINELAYNNLLSRNMNFRIDDMTGITNFKEPNIYFRRLFREEGDGIIEELRQHKLYFTFRTHEILPNLEYFNMLDINYYMLALFRNPVDLVHSYWKRGWGDRFGNDPRAFTLTIDYKEKQVPWYCAGFEGEWLSMNSMERCVRSIIFLIQESIDQYKKAPNKERIHLMTFEGFIRNPKQEIKKICAFLGTQETIYTEHFLRKDIRLSVLKPDKRKLRIEDIKSNANNKLFDKLMELTKEYESTFYNLQSL
jgi:hypothetical protein